MAKKYSLGISVIIPCRNEALNVPKLASEIDHAFSSFPYSWEVIWVNDGSSDNTHNILRELGAKHKFLNLPVRVGQSSAIRKGIFQASYSWIGLIDGDGQNDPHDLIKMFSKTETSQLVDFYQGRRKNRSDHLMRRKLPSALANFVVRQIIGSPFSDLGCGTKLFRRVVSEVVPFSGEIHRLYAAHAYLAGFSVEEVEVSHRSREFGKSSYGFERIPKFFLDILLARLRVSATRNPFYFLGFTSLTIFSLGLAMWIVAALLRALDIKDYFDGSLIVGGLVSMLFGIALLMITILLDIMNSKHEPDYPTELNR